MVFKVVFEIGGSIFRMVLKTEKLILSSFFIIWKTVLKVYLEIAGSIFMNISGYFLDFVG